MMSWTLVKVSESMSGWWRLWSSTLADDAEGAEVLEDAVDLGGVERQPLMRACRPAAQAFGSERSQRAAKL